MRREEDTYLLKRGRSDDNGPIGGGDVDSSGFELILKKRMEIYIRL